MQLGQMEGFDYKRLRRGAEPRHPKKVKAVCPTRGRLPAEIRGMILITDNPALGTPLKDTILD